MRQSILTLAEHHCRSLKTNPVAPTELWDRYGKDKTIGLDEVYETYVDYIPHYFEDGMPLSLMLGGVFMCRKGSTDWVIPQQKYDGSDVCLRQTICGHARQTLYISPEGRMLPCMSLSSADVQYGYPLIGEAGLHQGLTDSTYMKLIDTRVDEFFRTVPECGECEYAKICAGGCRASALSAGDTLMSPDRACCILFKEGWADKIRSAASRSAEAAAARAETAPPA
ncbi:MAG: SPASM domain-containing protein [Lachnospiraceae bacterium]|nr:SPASM domain-containing protein [Lachnospiraceae bacterium]